MPENRIILVCGYARINQQYEPGDSPIVTEEGEPIITEDEEFVFIPEIDIMEAVKISQMTEITDLPDGAYLPIVDEGDNFKITKANFLALIQAQVTAAVGDISEINDNISSLTLELSRKVQWFAFEVPFVPVPSSPWSVTSAQFAGKDIKAIMIGRQTLNVDQDFTQIGNTIELTDAMESFNTGEVLNMFFTTEE